MTDFDSKIHYRGFTGNIEYEPDDELFYADCMVIGDMLVASGRNLTELLDSFHRVVDDYIYRMRKLDDNA